MNLRKRSALILAGILWGAGIPVLSAEAATRRVPEDYSTIQAAIDAAQTGDTIQVAAGTYPQNLLIQKNGILLQGAGKGLSIIQGADQINPTVRIRNVDGSVRLKGFTISNGFSNSDLWGGGVDIESASPVIEDNEISGNSSRVLGGGLAIRWTTSNPSILRNVIRNNRASNRQPGDWGGYGGGVYVGGGARGTFSGNQITDNRAWASGGGILCGSIPALSLAGASPLLYNNLIARNSSDYEGGVFVTGSDSFPTLQNNLIVDNFASWQGGGGISVTSGKAVILNNTVVGTQGGNSTAYGIYVGDSALPVEVRNNIVAFNENVGIRAIASTVLQYNDVYSHPQGNYAGSGVAGTGSISLDPLFVNRSAGDYHLSPGSPAINAGDPSLAYNDADGSRNDMGAYGGPGINSAPVAQNQSVSVSPNTPKAVTLAATDPDGNSLTYAIVTGPTKGSLSGTPPAVTYTPNAGYSGPDSFTFKANDGRVDSNVATVSITVGVPQMPQAYQDKLRQYAEAAARYFTSPQSNNKLAGLTHAFFGEAAVGAWRECDASGNCSSPAWALTRGYGAHVNLNEVTLRFLSMAAAYKMGWQNYLPGSSRYAESWGQIKTGLETLQLLQTSTDPEKYEKGTFHRAYITTISQGGQFDVDRTPAQITRTGAFEQSSDDNGLAYVNLLVLEGLANDPQVSVPDRQAIAALCQAIRSRIYLRRFMVNGTIVHNFVNGTPSSLGWDRVGAEGALILGSMLLSGNITLNEFYQVAPSLQNRQVNWTSLQAGTIPIEQATYHSALFIHGLRSLHGMPVTPGEFPGAAYFRESLKPIFSAHMDLAQSRNLKALGSQPMTQPLQGYPLFEYWSGASEFSGELEQIQYAGNEENRMPDPTRITGAGAMARGTAPHAWFVGLSRWRELPGSQMDALFSWMADYEREFFHLGSDTLLGWEAVVPWTPTDTRYTWSGGGRTNYTDWGRPYEALNAAYSVLHIFDALNPDRPLASYSVEAQRMGHLAAYFDSGTPLPPNLFQSPDLRMTAVSGPSSAVVGSSVTLANTVLNQGGGGSGGFDIRFYLSTDAAVTTADLLLGSRHVNGLAAGASDSTSIQVTIPGTLALGTYYVGAIADPLAQLPETNETNNALAGNTIAVTAPLPDLVMTAVSGPASVVAGNAVSVNSTVKNQGAGNAGGFSVGLYLSTDSTITTSDRLLGSRMVSSLAAGASSTAATSVVVPVSVASGTYYVGAVADYANGAGETNESNNALAGNTIAVTALLPDLVMTAVYGPLSVAAGGMIWVNHTVKNQGAGGAGGFDIGLYLSADTAVTTTDVFLGSRHVNGLAAGVSDNASVQVTIPGGLAVGTYYVGAIADSTGSVSETNESNNARAGNTIAVTAPRPDLVMTAVYGPLSVVAGGMIWVNHTVKNQGADGAGGFDIGLYLSADTAVTTADVFLGSRHVNGLAAGVSDNASVQVAIPSGLAVGTYYVGAIADSTGSVSETNESNNSRAGNTIAVTALLPDLVMTAVYGPLSVAAGGMIWVNHTVKNQGAGGAGGFDIGLYLSADTAVTTTDVFLGSRHVNGLAAGVSDNASVQVAIPGGLAVGTYYVGAIADSTGGASETNESNNSRAGNKITVQ